MPAEPPRVVLLMGVSGSGKTTIGQEVARMLGYTFVDADDHHSAESVRKMAGGTPLDDSDRAAWLERLSLVCKQALADGESLVLACSALKRAYREQIRGGDPRVELVYLKGSFELISQRLRERQGHFMPPALLRSQFDALEEPRRARVVEISPPLTDVVRQVVMLLRQQQRQQQDHQETGGSDQGGHHRP